MTEAALADARAAILPFCRQLAGGDSHRAEDLAQEALLVALGQLRAGRDVADWTRWLAGIARTLAKRGATVFGELPDSLPGDADPLDGLLDAERGALVERAMADLPAESRSLLVARFVDELPVGEIAGRLGIDPNAAHQRLFRARAALQKRLAGDLRDAAAAHGLLPAHAADGWVETPLFCPRCADRRLQGRLDDHLALRCPGCDPGDGLQGLGTRAAPLPAAAVLDGARGFRVALRRVNAWWQDYLADGIARRVVRCVHCAAPTPLIAAQPPCFRTVCGRCGRSFTVHAAGLLLHSDEGQAFWRDHPRLRYRNFGATVCEGEAAFAVGYEDRAGGATLTAVYAQSDLRRLRLEKNGKRA